MKRCTHVKKSVVCGKKATHYLDFFIKGVGIERMFYCHEHKELPTPGKKRKISP